jgi:hypothetical protein
LTNTICQPKFTLSNTKDLLEGSNNTPICGELSADGIETLEPGFVIPDFKTETFSTVSFTNRGKRSISLPTSIDTSSLLKVPFSISQNSDNYPIYLNSTPVDSPTYSPCESEETSPHFPNSSFSSFLSLDNQSPKTILPYSSITKRLPHLFKNLPYSSQVSASKSSMAAARGGGDGGSVGGGGGGGQVTLP